MTLNIILAHIGRQTTNFTYDSRIFHRVTLDSFSPEEIESKNWKFTNITI
jgi:hypothetical protein